MRLSMVDRIITLTYQLLSKSIIMYSSFIFISSELSSYVRCSVQTFFLVPLCISVLIYFIILFNYESVLFGQ